MKPLWAGGSAGLPLAWLLAEGLLLCCHGPRAALAAQGGLLGARRELPPLHQLRPGPPSPEQSSLRYTSSAKAAAARQREADAAAVAAAAAEGRRRAAAGRLTAATREVALSEAANRELTLARSIEFKEREIVEEAEEAQRILGQVPAVAERAARRAVADVHAETVRALQDEVRQVADQARRVNSSGKEAEERADNVQAAAMPFLLAKLRTAQVMWGHVSQARELASAVVQLKNKAMETAQASQVLQAGGNSVRALQLQDLARGMMAKAQRLEAEAEAQQAEAARLDRRLPAYDGAAQAAAAREAEASLPLGDAKSEIPELPFPLEVPEPVGKTEQE